MLSRGIKYLVLIVFLGFLVFVTLNRHSRSGIQNYHSEIWGDKAGYFVYFPALFMYNFQAEKLPTDIDVKTGNGFSLKDGKIRTKYTYGVALMLSPSLIACHYLSKRLGYYDNGFTLIYHKAIDISAAIYSFFSLILLYLFLIRYVCKRISVITIICLYLGTNIFYFSIFETGMSHIYSLFLFTCYIYLAPFVIKQNQKTIFYILFGLITGLILVVRPINIVFLPVFFIFNTIRFSEIKNNISKWAAAGISTILVIIPQFIYWKYAYDNYFHYSYGNETFSNIFEPKLLYLWFSTNNGLFIYNPLMIIILAGLLFYYKESAKKSVFISVYFLFISILFSSWYDWGYGCSYGCRPYVEYYPILALPFSFFLNAMDKHTVLKFIFLPILLVFILYNLKMIFSFDGCFTGGTWDWAELLRLVLSPTK